MSDDEIYYWVYTQKKDKHISSTIKQFHPEEELTRIFNITNIQLVDEEFYRNELLIKMLEVDLDKGLMDEADVIF